MIRSAAAAGSSSPVSTMTRGRQAPKRARPSARLGRQECPRVLAVGRPMRPLEAGGHAGRGIAGEAPPEDRRIRPQPRHGDTGRPEGGAAGRVVDDGCGSRDHGRPVGREGLAQEPRFGAMERLDAFLVAQRGGRPPQGGLQHRVAIAERHPQGSRHQHPGRGLPGPHQPDEDDVAELHGCLVRWPVRHERLVNPPPARPPRRSPPPLALRGARAPARRRPRCPGPPRSPPARPTGPGGSTGSRAA